MLLATVIYSYESVMLVTLAAPLCALHLPNRYAFWPRASIITLIRTLAIASGLTLGYAGFDRSLLSLCHDFLYVVVWQEYGEPLEIIVLLFGVFVLPWSCPIARHAWPHASRRWLHLIPAAYVLIAPASWFAANMVNYDWPNPLSPLLPAILFLPSWVIMRARFTRLTLPAASMKRRVV